MIIVAIQTHQIFPAYCWSRDYLLYPNYNYLSWSYAAGLLSVIALSFASAAYFQVPITALKCNFFKNEILVGIFIEQRKRIQESVNFIYALSCLRPTRCKPAGGIFIRLRVRFSLNCCD